ncbi:unnamed protein product [Urochloa decumbens]|uniref:Late embryogenesis abundant protein LEA-2 subgroup domain-containing protein n=1 Tax=Urochloa decumbens TaxID=240449 RepID=A0ABC8Z7Z7_9POAL
MEQLESKTQEIVAHAISLSIFLAVILWAVWTTCVNMRDDTEFSKGYYQVEITGVEAPAGFPAAQPEAASSPPRFNITARVVNRHKNEQLLLQSWVVDVSYAGIPLGTGSLPEICLEKMAEKEVTVTTSTELIGLDAEVRRRAELLESQLGGLQLQIDMLLSYTVRRRSGRLIHSKHWLWCNAKLGGQSSPYRCHIYQYRKPIALFSPDGLH